MSVAAAGELKVKIARLACQFPHSSLNDRLARFIAVVDRIAEALQFFQQAVFIGIDVRLRGERHNLL